MWELKIILGQFALKKIATPDNFPLDDFSPDNYNPGKMPPPPSSHACPTDNFPKQNYPTRKLLPELIALTQVNSPERSHST